MSARRDVTDEAQQRRQQQHRLGPSGQPVLSVRHHLRRGNHAPIVVLCPSWSTSSTVRALGVSLKASVPPVAPAKSLTGSVLPTPEVEETAKLSTPGLETIAVAVCV